MKNSKNTVRLARSILVQASLLAGLFAFLVNAGVSVASGAGPLTAIFRGSVTLAGVAGLGVIVLPRLTGVLLGSRHSTPSRDAAEMPGSPNHQRDQPAGSDRSER